MKNDTSKVDLRPTLSEKEERPSVQRLWGTGNTLAILGKKRKLELWLEKDEKVFRNGRQ